MKLTRERLSEIEEAHAESGIGASAEAQQMVNELLLHAEETLSDCQKLPTLRDADAMLEARKEKTP